MRTHVTRVPDLKKHLLKAVVVQVETDPNVLQLQNQTVGLRFPSELVKEQEPLALQQRKSVFQTMTKIIR